MKKLFKIEGIGTVEIESSVWIHCRNIESRDNMEIGDTCYLDFVSGMGKSTLAVTRLQ